MWVDSGARGSSVLSRRPSRRSQPLLELVPLLPGCLFRGGLMKVIIPVLSTCIGLVAGIEGLLLGLTGVGGGPGMVSFTP